MRFLQKFKQDMVMNYYELRDSGDGAFLCKFGHGASLRLPAQYSRFVIVSSFYYFVFVLYKKGQGYGKVL